jgi:hypothetical protein
MRQAPPVSRAAEETTFCPVRSTVLPKDAVAPLKIEAKKGSVITSCYHEATNSRARKSPSGWDRADGTVQSPGRSFTRVKLSGVKAHK